MDDEEAGSAVDWCYRKMLRGAVKSEWAQYQSRFSRPAAQLTREAQPDFGLYMHIRVANQYTMSQVGLLVSRWGLEAVHRAAAETVYKGFLRLTIVEDDGQTFALWRHCT